MSVLSSKNANLLFYGAVLKQAQYTQERHRPHWQKKKQPAVTNRSLRPNTCAFVILGSSWSPERDAHVDCTALQRRLLFVRSLHQKRTPEHYFLLVSKPSARRTRRLYCNTNSVNFDRLLGKRRTPVLNFGLASKPRARSTQRLHCNATKSAFPYARSAKNTRPIVIFSSFQSPERGVHAGCAALQRAPFSVRSLSEKLTPDCYFGLVSKPRARRTRWLRRNAMQSAFYTLALLKMHARL